MSAGDLESPEARCDKTMTARRPVDNYTLRRREELAARRRALPKTRQYFNNTPRPRPRPQAEQALALRQKHAIEVLKRIRHLREPKPQPGQHPGKWTLAQDRALLNAVAAGVPLDQLRDRIAPLRQSVTIGGCSHRFSRLARDWGVR